MPNQIESEPVAEIVPAPCPLCTWWQSSQYYRMPTTPVPVNDVHEAACFGFWAAFRLMKGMTLCPQHTGYMQIWDQREEQRQNHIKAQEAQSRVMEEIKKAVANRPAMVVEQPKVDDWIKQALNGEELKK